jgi:hypothetical protein
MDLMEQWADGVLQKETIQDTAEANAAALGQIEVLKRILGLTAEQINDTLNPDQADSELDVANRARTLAATGEI